MSQPINHASAPHPRVIALLNQKGGVGKTTSTVNIGAALAEMGKRVCLIDMDPQGHLSLHLGLDGESVGDTVYELLLEPDVPLEQVVVKVRPNLDCVPSKVDLAAAEIELANAPDRLKRLGDKFAPHMVDYDYILLDCPPSLGTLTLNALSMAQEVYVPMQAHFLAMQGFSKLLETVGEVCRNEVNTDLKVSGVILCMHEKHSTLVREVVGELDGFFEENRGNPLLSPFAKVLRPAIRKNIKLAEAPSFGQTIFDYAPWCPGALDYRTLAERIIAQLETDSSEEVTSATSSHTDSDEVSTAPEVSEVREPEEVHDTEHESTEIPVPQAKINPSDQPDPVKKADDPEPLDPVAAGTISVEPRTRSSDETVTPKSKSKPKSKNPG